MRRLLGIGVLTLLALAMWVGLVVVGARAGWGRAMPAPRGDLAGFKRWAEGRYAAESKGDFAMVLLDRGVVANTSFASRGRVVDGHSVFQVASMSKWITAWGVMTLVEQHRVDLDAPVSRYIRRWRLPPSTFDNNQVTVRRLLSHTAGLTDGLGFLGFATDRPLPTIERELVHAQDVQTGSSGVVRVGSRPGASWRYSGGGYLILQLLVEEVTGEPFEVYMRHTVLKPLGMNHSTFAYPDASALADNFTPAGSKTPYAHFVALGAASLFTSTSDLTYFLQAQVRGNDGAPPGRAVLRPVTLETMSQPQAFVFGLPIWGMGEALFSPNGAGGFVVGHDGFNAPAVNTTARIDPATGDGIIVLETGNPTLAREIGGEWIFWRTGVVGVDTLATIDARRLVMQLLVGALVILGGAFLIGRPSQRPA